MRSSGPAAALALLLAACSGEDAPDGTTMRTHELSLAVALSGATAAWHGGSGRGSAIFVQALDGDDQLTGTAVAISDGARLAYEPDILRAGNGLIVAWYERDPVAGDLSAWLAGTTQGGTIRWRLPLTAGGDRARNPVVRLVGDTLHAAWIEQASAGAGRGAATLWHQRFSIDGAPLGRPRPIGRADGDTWNLNAAVHRDRFLLVYDAALGTRAHELHMIAVGDDGVAHRALSADDGHGSFYPDLQISPSGQAALSWFDERDGNREVYLLTAPIDRLGRGAPALARRVSNSPGDTIGAYVAWNGERLGLAWVDTLERRRAVLVRTYAADGRALGPARRLSLPGTDAGVPAIRASRDGFLVAWNEYRLGTDAAHMNVTASHARFARVPISR